MRRCCNLCGARWVQFTSLKPLGARLKEYGFPYRLSDFETLAVNYYECTRCGASDRERLYKLYFDKHTLGRRSIIDFAPARALQNYLRQQAGLVYRSADLFMDGVDDVVDITNMTNYKNGQFDFFVCSHIIEHVDDKKALSELYRILKPGGCGIVMTPIIDNDDVFDEDMSVTDIGERWRRFAQDDHVRLYSKKVFLERLQEAGFTVRQYGARELGICNFLQFGITMHSVLYIVEKQ